MKMVRDKYIKLKMENTEQKKKLMSFEMQNRTLNSLSDVSTPIKSGNNRSSKMRYMDTSPKLKISNYFITSNSKEDNSWKIPFIF